MRVYYMTSAKWGEVILKERRLKVARFGELNDPFELALLDNRRHDARRFAKLITDHFHKNYGHICFGANWASPVMWAHYGDKHRGVALGFDVQDELLTKIDYTGKKISVPFGAQLPKHGLSEELLTKIRMTKSTDWAYEREYRVESALEHKDPDTGLHYVDFRTQVLLREVIAGYRCTWTTADIRRTLGAVTDSVRICNARPAFGKFEMVEDRQVKVVTVKPTRLIP